MKIGMVLVALMAATTVQAADVSLKFSDVGRAPYVADTHFSNIDIGGVSPLMSSDELIKSFKDRGYAVKEISGPIYVETDAGRVVYDSTLVEVDAEKNTDESKDHYAVIFASPAVGSRVKDIYRAYEFHYRPDQQRVKVDDFILEVRAKYGEPARSDGKKRLNYCTGASGAKLTDNSACFSPSAEIFLQITPNYLAEQTDPGSDYLSDYTVIWMNDGMEKADLGYLKSAGTKFIKEENERKAGRTRPKPKTNL